MAKGAPKEVKPSDEKLHQNYTNMHEVSIIKYNKDSDVTEARRALDELYQKTRHSAYIYYSVANENAREMMRILLILAEKKEQLEKERDAEVTSEARKEEIKDVIKNKIKLKINAITQIAKDPWAKNESTGQLYRDILTDRDRSVTPESDTLLKCAIGFIVAATIGAAIVAAVFCPPAIPVILAVGAVAALLAFTVAALAPMVKQAAHNIHGTVRQNTILKDALTKYGAEGGGLTSFAKAEDVNDSQVKEAIKPPSTPSN